MKSAGGADVCVRLYLCIAVYEMLFRTCWRWRCLPFFPCKKMTFLSSRLRFLFWIPRSQIWLGISALVGFTFYLFSSAKEDIGGLISLHRNAIVVWPPLAGGRRFKDVPVSWWCVLELSFCWRTRNQGRDQRPAGFEETEAWGLQMSDVPSRA